MKEERDKLDLQQRIHELEEEKAAQRREKESLEAKFKAVEEAH